MPKLCVLLLCSVNMPAKLHEKPSKLGKCELLSRPCISEGFALRVRGPSSFQQHDAYCPTHVGMCQNLGSYFHPAKVESWIWEAWHEVHNFGTGP